MEAQHNIAGWTSLDPLIERPDAKVLIVQGFEEYEIASRLITGMVAMTWTGEPDDLNVTPLRGRAVTIWPDWHHTMLVPAADRLAQALLPVAASVDMVQPKGADDIRTVVDFAKLPGIKAAMYARVRLHRVQRRVDPNEAQAPHQEPPKPAKGKRPELTVVEGGNALRKPLPVPRTSPDLPPAYSEDKLALTFGDQHGEDYRYVATWGKWLRWDGRRWAAEDTLAALNLAREICRASSYEATIDQTLTPSQQRTLSYRLTDNKTTNNVERFARTDRRMAITGDVFDRDIWTLNTPSGLVDLRDGSIRPARPDDHLTKMTNVGATDSPCPTWLRFIEQATQGDAELAGYLQRVAGYALTGCTREHALFFVHGPGGAGKGTFVNTLQWIMGDYATVASMETFTESKHDRHSTELAMLRGARMVTAQETEEGRRWAESRLKALTGGDPITARFMRMDNFTFVPHFKLVIAGNHRPGLRNVDEAIQRRMNLIPFTAKVAPSERDTNLPDKLKDEASGILRWAIDGCLAWQREGLARSERVASATTDYLENEDTIGTWIAECCTLDATARCRRGWLYQSYAQWCAAAGEFCIPLKRWIPQIEARGLVSRKINGNATVFGIELQVAREETAHARGGAWQD